ncbi:MAG: hypothetical protein HY735_10285 [Verrucomicrobia bacterium]|nr:hypothetical protein [Verrucomicrobiota bacterium]
MSLSKGQPLGPYEIVSQIGAGGMGEVYRARDTRLDRIVAVKCLLPQSRNSESLTLNPPLQAHETHERQET